MSRKMISLGGWCAPAMALEKRGLRVEALPFDYIRITFQGVIDCIENDFAGFFPKRIRPERILFFRAFRGRFAGFFHHNLEDEAVIETFRRRIARFSEILRTSDEILFIRTIVDPDFEKELALVPSFERAIATRYPGLDFRLALVVQNQQRTEPVAKVNERTLLFTMKYTRGKLRDRLRASNFLAARSMDGYEAILDYLASNDLFERVPEIEAECGIEKDESVWFVHGVPMVDPDN